MGGGGRVRRVEIRAMHRREDEWAAGGHVLAAVHLDAVPQLERTDHQRAAERVEHPRPGPVSGHRRFDACHGNSARISATMSSTALSVVSMCTASARSPSGECPTLIASVALGDRGRHRFVVEVGDLPIPPPSARLHRRVEIDLQLGIREHDRADVAPLDHAAAVRVGPLTLAATELGADCLVRRHRAHGARDLGAADLDGRVGAVHEHTGVAYVETHVGRETRHLLGAVGVDAPPQRGEGDPAVLRTGVEIVEAEPVGQCPGDGRLPRAGRSVDGDDPHRDGHPTRRPTASRASPGRRSTRETSWPRSRDRRSRRRGTRRPSRAKLMAMRWSS